MGVGLMLHCSGKDVQKHFLLNSIWPQGVIFFKALTFIKKENGFKIPASGNSLLAFKKRKKKEHRQSTPKTLSFFETYVDFKGDPHAKKSARFP